MSEVELPEPPEKPLPSDCCNSGCTPCILDVHEDLLKKWEEKCKLLQAGRVVDKVQLESVPILFQSKYSTFKIVSVTSLTHDTDLYHLQAVEEVQGCYREVKTPLDFKPSQYFILQGTETVDNGKKSFSRAYTPISDKSVSLEGCFDVVIKLYPDGKMSRYLQKLKIGDITLWRGPYGGFDYKPNTYKRILMVCAGTGIAPLYSLAQSIVGYDEDETVIKLLFCCGNVASILLRKQIHTLQSFWNFSADIFVPYSSSHEYKPLYGETLKNVRLGQDAIASELDIENVADIMVLICGSHQFCKDVEQFVRNCGVDSQHIHIF